MIEDKIRRYRNEITLARELSKMRYADTDYYENLVIKFEKILRFYEDLKSIRNL